jgi:hypothetical protein
MPASMRAFSSSSLSAHTPLCFKLAQASCESPLFSQPTHVSRSAASGSFELRDGSSLACRLQAREAR